MDNAFYSIIEKLAILEGRIAPKDKETLSAAKQKKPALFNNLKKADENVIPDVGGVPVAETNMEEDVVSKVKASLADYLKSAEQELKQDSDLIKKKKQDLDLKKKELKDLDLQQKETMEELDENHQQLEVGDRICIIGHNDHQGEFGEVAEFAPSGKFVIVKFDNGDEASMHISDVEFHDDQEDAEDWEDADEFDMPDSEFFKENPTEAPPQSASGGSSNPTYAESTTAPVKTIHVPVGEEVGLSGGGGSLLAEIHGDERDGFCIKRAGRELPTKFKTLEEAELALEMFVARRKAQRDAEKTADYIEEK